MKQATIKRFGQYLVITPPVPELAAALTTRRHVAIDDASYGTRIEQKPFPLCWLDKDRWGATALVTYAGMEQKAVLLLEECGYRVQVLDWHFRQQGESFQRVRRVRRLQLNESHFEQAGPDRSVVDFIRENERGLIRYAPGRIRLDWLIAQVATAYPQRSILVIATRRNDVRHIFRKLREQGLRTAKVLYGAHPRGRHQVVVTTCLGVGAGTATARHRDIVFYTNPEEMFTYVGMYALHELQRARVFGFLPEGELPPSPVGGMIESVFGQQSITLLQHGFATRPVKVIFVRSRVKSRMQSGETGFATRKRVVWRQELRNARIARLAELLAMDDKSGLCSAFSGWSGGYYVPGDPRVGVVVDSVDHGLAIARHLKDWTLLVGAGAQTQQLSAKEIARLTMVDEHPGRFTSDAIVTYRSLPHAGKFDVLVRADAGTGGLPLDDQQRSTKSQPGEPLLVVDFDDRHHPLVRRWTRQRKAAYEQQQWDVTGGPEVREADRREISRQPAPRSVLPYESRNRTRTTDEPRRTSAWWYRHRRKQQQNHYRKANGGVLTLDEIADRDHLVDSLSKLQREGGAAAGVDGIWPHDISPFDMGEIARHLSRSLREQRFGRQPAKPAPVPKPGTDEKRLLKIGVTVDRWVEKAVHAKISPLLEKRFVDSSWGFRSRRGVWRMLAAMEFTIERTGYKVLAIDDVRKAFDNTPVSRAIEAFRRTVNGKRPAVAGEVIELLETLLTGHDPFHETGIDQGGCTSPGALNTLLHMHHDVPLETSTKTPFRFRYADNLAYVCRNVTEGRKILSTTGALLAEAGLALKGQGGGVFNLASGRKAQVLGLLLSWKDGCLRYDLPEDWRDRLRQNLLDARDTLDPAQAAVDAVQAWIGAYGPAFKNGVAVIPQILSLAVEMGFREFPDVESLHSSWEIAHDRWRMLRNKERRRMGKRLKASMS